MTDTERRSSELEVLCACGEICALRAKRAVIDEIAAERQRQIDSEGMHAEHDDEWENGQLARAAAAYTLGNYTIWPWAMEWWNPKDNRRNLIRAAALLVAEIERLDRASP